MLIFPAIDLFKGKVVRLYRGDYSKMTVYSEEPPTVARDFAEKGAECVHIVDLEGAKSGETPGFEAVLKIKRESGLFCEVGGGIRSMETVKKYLDAGIDRVILGTAAVKDKAFTEAAAAAFGEKIAVGIDIKDGFAAVSGWTQSSQYTAGRLCEEMKELGITTFICTDVAKDGAMQGTNHALYAELSRTAGIRMIASGGVSSIEDVRRLSAAGLYGAIIGKAYYTNAVDLKTAIEAAK